MTYPTVAKSFYMLMFVSFLGAGFLIDYLGHFEFFIFVLLFVLLLNVWVSKALLRCPVCRESVGRSKSGYYAPWIGPSCRYCGSDLSKRHVNFRAPFPPAREG